MTFEGGDDFIPEGMVDSKDDPTGIVGNLSYFLTNLSHDIGEGGMKVREVLRDFGWSVEQIKLWENHIWTETERFRGLATEEGRFSETEGMAVKEGESVARAQEVFTQEFLNKLFDRKRDGKPWRVSAVGLKFKRNNEGKVTSFKPELIKREFPIIVRVVRENEAGELLGFVDIEVQEHVKKDGEHVNNPWKLLEVQKLLDGFTQDLTGIDGIRILDGKPMADWYREGEQKDKFGEFTRPDVIIGRGEKGSRLGDLTRDRREVVYLELSRPIENRGTVTAMPSNHLSIDGAHLTIAIRHAQQSSEYKNLIIGNKEAAMQAIADIGEMDGYGVPLISRLANYYKDFPDEDVSIIERRLSLSTFEFPEMLEFADLVNLRQHIFTSEVPIDLAQLQLDLGPKVFGKRGQNLKNILVMCMVQYMVNRRMPGFPLMPVGEKVGEERLAENGIGNPTIRKLEEVMSQISGINKTDLEKYLSRRRTLELWENAIADTRSSNEAWVVLTSKLQEDLADYKINISLISEMMKFLKEFSDDYAWIRSVKEKLASGKLDELFSEEDLLRDEEKDSQRAKKIDLILEKWSFLRKPILFGAKDVNEELENLADSLLDKGNLKDFIFNLIIKFENLNLAEGSDREVDLNELIEIVTRKGSLQLQEDEVLKIIEGAKYQYEDGIEILNKGEWSLIVDVVKEKLIALSIKQFELDGLKQKLLLWQEKLDEGEGKKHTNIFQAMLGQTGKISRIIDQIVGNPSRAASSVNALIGVVRTFESLGEKGAGKVIAAMRPEEHNTSQPLERGIFLTALASHPTQGGWALTLRPTIVADSEKKVVDKNILNLKETMNPRKQLEVVLPVVRSRKNWIDGIMNVARLEIKEKIEKSRGGKLFEKITQDGAKELALLEKILVDKEFSTMGDPIDSLDSENRSYLEESGRIMGPLYEARKAKAAQDADTRSTLTDEALLFFRYFNKFVKESDEKEVKDFTKSGFAEIWRVNQEYQHAMWKAQLSNLLYALYGMSDPGQFNYQVVKIQSRENLQMQLTYEKLRSLSISRKVENG